jgi:acetyl esterase/lipase
VQLGSWTDLRPDYSGSAAYSISFTLPESGLDAERQWHVDLGKVSDVARIEINGQKLEPMLWAPYQQDLTPHLRAGDNQLKVYVSNTLANKHGAPKPSGLLGPVTLNAKHVQKLEFSPVAGPGYQPVVLPTAADLSGTSLISEYVYREVGDAALKMKLWYPAGWKPGDPKLPATAFIFGGGWYMGATSQFNMLGPYLNNRGMIVVAPEYRTHLDGVPPNICLEDAKSAMRYIYKHADELGIDANRVAAGGRSAGGHLAAAAAYCEGFNSPGDDLSLPVKPKALILFNPVIDNGPDGFRHDSVKDYWQGFSPLHNIAKNSPPTIFLTGDKDQYTPIETARKYQQAQEAKGGRCDLVVFNDGVHGSPFAAQFYQQTLDEMDAFLVSIDYLPAKN